MKLVIAMTGASGALYTQRLLDNLDPTTHEIHFIATKHAMEVAQLELPKGELRIALVIGWGYDADERNVGHIN